MIHLFFLILLRITDGCRNGFYYAGDVYMRNIAALCGVVAMATYGVAIGTAWALLPITISLIYLRYGFGKYLHVFDQLTIMSFYLAMIFAGCDLLMLPMTALFVNMFFKGMINLTTDEPFIKRIDSTDDASGKTLGYPTPFGMFRVPRIANGYVSAAVGVVLAGIWAIYNQFYYFDLQTVINIIVNLF